MAAKTKLELQEEALQLGVDIYGDADSNDELTKADLKSAIAVALAENAAQAEADKAEADSARASAAEADKAEVAAQAAKDDAVKSPTTVDAAPELLKKMGLPGSSKADRELAIKHGYPVAIPGGKAYRTRISFHCAMGGGERPMGSVVILTDAHAANKLEYLKAV